MRATISCTSIITSQLLEKLTHPLRFAGLSDGAGTREVSTYLKQLHCSQARLTLATTVQQQGDRKPHVLHSSPSTWVPNLYPSGPLHVCCSWKKLLIPQFNISFKRKTTKSQLEGALKSFVLDINNQLACLKPYAPCASERETSTRIQGPVPSEGAFATSRRTDHSPPSRAPCSSLHPPSAVEGIVYYYY